MLAVIIIRMYSSYNYKDVSTIACCGGRRPPLRITTYLNITPLHHNNIYHLSPPQHLSPSTSTTYLNISTYNISTRYAKTTFLYKINPCNAHATRFLFNFATKYLRL